MLSIPVPPPLSLGKKIADNLYAQEHCLVEKQGPENAFFSEQYFKTVKVTHIVQLVCISNK